MRLCPRCSGTKPDGEFGVRPNGRALTYCKPCTVDYRREWYLKNADRVRGKTRAWAAANKVRKAESDRIYRIENRERVDSKRRARYPAYKARALENSRRWYLKNRDKADAASKRWIRENPEYVAARSRILKTKRKQAAVKWADRHAVASFYREAKRLTGETGIPHEVDHIFPLVSPFVCGLHCESNLRVVPRAVNRSKGNRLDVAQAA